jgi:hypothetical protein
VSLISQPTRNWGESPVLLTWQPSGLPSICSSPQLDSTALLPSCLFACRTIILVTGPKEKMVHLFSHWCSTCYSLNMCPPPQGPGVKGLVLNLWCLLGTFKKWGQGKEVSSLGVCLEWVWPPHLSLFPGINEMNRPPTFMLLPWCTMLPQAKGNGANSSWTENITPKYNFSSYKLIISGIVSQWWKATTDFYTWGVVMSTGVLFPSSCPCVVDN